MNTLVIHPRIDDDGSVRIYATLDGVTRVSELSPETDNIGDALAFGDMLGFVEARNVETFYPEYVIDLDDNEAADYAAPITAAVRAWKVASPAARAA